jgi:hypothetical protein
MITPTSIGSWLHTIDEVVVLGCGHDAEVLLVAVSQALSWSTTFDDKKSTCIPSFWISEQGAGI